MPMTNDQSLENKPKAFSVRLKFYSFVFMGLEILAAVFSQTITKTMVVESF